MEGLHWDSGRTSIIWNGKRTNSTNTTQHRFLPLQLKHKSTRIAKISLSTL